MADSKDEAEARVENRLDAAAQRIGRMNPSILKVTIDLPPCLVGRRFARRLKAVGREKR